MLDRIQLLDTVLDMTSGDYERRFIAEYKQLNIRLHKLQDTIDKYEKNKLDFYLKTPIGILKRQLRYMIEYEAILYYRAKLENIDLEEEFNA